MPDAAETTYASAYAMPGIGIVPPVPQPVAPLPAPSILQRFDAVLAREAATVESAAGAVANAVRHAMGPAMGPINAIAPEAIAAKPIIADHLGKAQGHSFSIIALARRVIAMAERLGAPASDKPSSPLEDPPTATSNVPPSHIAWLGSIIERSDRGIDILEDALSRLERAI